MKDKQFSIGLDQKQIAYYLKDVKKLKVMTPERERELSEIMCSGNVSEEQKNSIYQELIDGNLRFVITVAKQYQNQGMDLDDLIAEGNVGLLKAIQNFDWTKKLRFISYAVWWIKQSIFQSLNEHSRTIRLPVNIVQEMQKEKKNFKPINEFEFNDKFANLPTTSSYNKINEEGDEYISSLADTNGEMPDDPFDTKVQLIAKLMTMLDILDSRERGIISEYFGLSGKPKTLEEIGSGLNLTKERVRQIKEKALSKLRNDSMELFEYM